MSYRKELSLEDIAREVPLLSEKVERVLPTYVASLRRVSEMPVEFERHFWASRVDALLQTVRADYENFQAKAQKVEFLGKFMTLGMDIVLKAGGLEPIAPPPPARLGISILPSGKIGSALFEDPPKQPDAVIVTYEEFVAIAERLKDGLLKGTVAPTSEDEIPKLIYNLASKSP
jgi:hypothetical protein